ncbi:MAG: hypothetical protein QW279_14835, partial [Candidatus Jordarchaeaceae archaeon]
MENFKSVLTNTDNDVNLGNNYLLDDSLSETPILSFSEIEVLFWASLLPLVGAILLLVSKGKISFQEPKGVVWALVAGLFGFLGL